MGLPFKPIAEVLTADDVQSYQHEQRLADRLIDAKTLVSVQHVNEGGNAYYSGNHDSPQFPIAMGIYTMKSDPWEEDPIKPEIQRNIASHGWTHFRSNASTPARDHFQLDLEIAPNLVVVGASAMVGFAIVPTVTPNSDLQAVAPYVWKSTEGGQKVHVYFGSFDVAAVLQIGVLVHGYVDPNARNAHR